MGTSALWVERAHRVQPFEASPFGPNWLRCGETDDDDDDADDDDNDDGDDDDMRV